MVSRINILYDKYGRVGLDTPLASSYSQNFAKFIKLKRIQAAMY